MRAAGAAGQATRSFAVTNPKVVTATNPGETGEGLARPKTRHPRGSMMMTAIYSIASVLLPTF